MATTRPWDLALVAAVTLLTLGVVTAAPWPPLRVPLGLLFILVAPGYALVAALFPERQRPAPRSAAADAVSTRGLGALERAALSLGLSIAVVPLLGLALNYTPWGIRLTPLLVTVAAFTLGMTAIAYRRRAKLPGLLRLQIAFTLEPPAWRGLGPLDKALTVALVVAILVAAGAVAYVATAPRPGESFTEFYVLGPGGMAEDYPTQLAPGENGTAIVGVRNHEGAPTTYLVRASWVSGNVSANETGAETFVETGRAPFAAYGVELADEANDERNLTFQAPSTPGRYRLELHLLRGVGEEPYRSLHLWVRVV